MNKLLKILLSAIGIIAVLLIIAAVVLPMVIDPNDYKQDISDAVQKNTGREFVIGGEIEWTVFPWIGLSVSDVELGNRAGFGEQPMFTAGQAGASVKLMPLFSKRLELGKVTLSDMMVNLQRKANGQNNWEDLSQSEASTTGEPAEPGGLDDFSVSGIEISNANVTWRDAGETTELKGFHLQAANIELGQPFDMEGGFSISLPQSQVSGDAEFGGRFDSATDGSRYGIEGLSFEFDGQKGAGADAVNLDLAIGANASIDLANDSAQLSGFELRFHDMEITGDLAVSALSKAPTFEGQLRVAEFSPRALIEGLGGQAPETASPEALTSLQADMNFAGTSNSANMRNLTVKFDKSTFQGNLRVDGFNTPKLAFDFNIDSLNLDDYVTESGETASQAQPQDLESESFRGFTGGGDFSIGTLVVSGLTATDVRMKLNSNGRVVRLAPINALFYGGKYQGDISINASGDRPIMTGKQDLTGIQAQGLLQDLTGQAQLEGLGDFNLNIRTDLTNPDTIRRALSGNLAMKFTDGAIVGIDVAETIRAAKSAFGMETESAAAAAGDPKTDFSELSLSGVIDRGVLKSDDLNMQSPLLRVTGEGQIDLTEETVDYLVEPVLVSSLEGQGGTGIDKLSGVPIPVRIRGSVLQPDISVDIMAAVTGSQKELINQKKDELANKALNKLFGSDDKQDKGDDSGAQGSESATGQSATGDTGAKAQDDPASALIGSLFGDDKDDKKKDGKKGKKKDKKKNKKNPDDPDGGKKD